MKYFACLLFSVILVACHSNEFKKKPRIPSSIDQLHTKAAIEAFIRKSDTNYKKYELKKLQDFHRSYNNDSINRVLANRLHINTQFEKADFDNNGYTDLLVIGDNHTCSSSSVEPCSFTPIVVMNFGPNNIKIIPINLDYTDAIAPLVSYKEDQPFLMVFKKKRDYITKKIIKKKYQLTYRFDNFIEYNPHPSSRTVSNIQFISGLCFGECPYYKLELSNQGQSTFYAYEYNRPTATSSPSMLMEGVYTTTLSSRTFKKLEELINYCDFQNNKNNYFVTRTCSSTGYIKITYTNGEVKRIQDYGMVGTYGLRILYHEFAKLRFNHQWKKVKAKAPINFEDIRGYN